MWRIHKGSRQPAEFNWTGAEAKRAEPERNGREGRFDCQRGEYGYLYAGETQAATIAEAFLRGSAVANPAARFELRRTYRPYVLSRLVVGQDLALADLRGAEALGRIGQDAWLTSSDEVDYPIAQEWATAIRRWAPDAHGMIWRAKRDNDHFAVVLFEDRGTRSFIEGEARRRFEVERDMNVLVKTLSRFNVTIGDADGGYR